MGQWNSSTFQVFQAMFQPWLMHRKYTRWGGKEDAEEQVRKMLTWFPTSQNFWNPVHTTGLKAWRAIINLYMIIKWNFRGNHEMDILRHYTCLILNLFWNHITVVKDENAKIFRFTLLINRTLLISFTWTFNQVL